MNANLGTVAGAGARMRRRGKDATFADKYADEAIPAIQSAASPRPKAKLSGASSKTEKTWNPTEPEGGKRSGVHKASNEKQASAILPSDPLLRSNQHQNQFSSGTSAGRFHGRERAHNSHKTGYKSSNNSNGHGHKGNNQSYNKRNGIQEDRRLDNPPAVKHVAKKRTGKTKMQTQDGKPNQLLSLMPKTGNSKTPSSVVTGRDTKTGITKGFPKFHGFDFESKTETHNTHTRFKDSDEGSDSKSDGDKGDEGQSRDKAEIRFCRKVGVETDHSDREPASSVKRHQCNSMSLEQTKDVSSKDREVLSRRRDADHGYIDSHENQFVQTDVVDQSINWASDGDRWSYAKMLGESRDRMSKNDIEIDSIVQAPLLRPENASQIPTSQPDQNLPYGSGVTDAVDLCSSDNDTVGESIHPFQKKHQHQGKISSDSERDEMDSPRCSSNNKCTQSEDLLPERENLSGTVVPLAQESQSGNCPALPVNSVNKVMDVEEACIHDATSLRKVSDTRLDISKKESSLDNMCGESGGIQTSNVSSLANSAALLSLSGPVPETEKKGLADGDSVFENNFSSSRTQSALNDIDDITGDARPSSESATLQDTGHIYISKISNLGAFASSGVGDLIGDEDSQNSSPACRSIVGHTIPSARRSKLKRKGPATKIVPGSSFVSKIDPPQTGNKPSSMGSLSDEYTPSVSKRRKLDSNNQLGSRTNTPHHTRFRTRQQKESEVIDIGSGSEAELDSLEGGAISTQYNAIRISIGKKLFVASCFVVIDNNLGTLILSFESNGQTQKMYISDKTISELKYHLGRYYDTETGADSGRSFVAMRVRPDKHNGLSKYSNAYRYDETGFDERNFVLLEFTTNDLAGFISDLEEFFPKFENSVEMISDSETALRYSSVFDKSRKRPSSRLKPLSARDCHIPTGPDGTLLVFPFEMKAIELEKAVVGLDEVQIKGNQVKGSSPNVGMVTESMFRLEDNTDHDETILPVTRGRAQFVTLRLDDYLLLEDFEFLNDNLIDFWMQWLLLGEKDEHADRVHIFSTHFFSTLNDNSPEAVRSWTAKKSIDVFTKKLVFVPINMSLHWSLCVLVNPGDILVQFKERHPSHDDPCPCIIFLDSLNAHQKGKICKRIRVWLNSEWNRLKKPRLKMELGEVFTSTSFPVLSPEVPRQNNSWDCGVFVCRYAESIFRLRNKSFSFRELSTTSGAPSSQAPLITESENFQFGMSNIKQLRKDMKKLIQRLSKLYLDLRRERDQERKAAKQKTDNPVCIVSEQSLTAAAIRNTPVQEEKASPEPAMITYDHYYGTSGNNTEETLPHEAEPSPYSVAPKDDASEFSDAPSSRSTESNTSRLERAEV